MTKEINVLTKELEATYCKRPSEHVIVDKLTGMKEQEKLQISSTSETLRVTNLIDIIVDPFPIMNRLLFLMKEKVSLQHTYGGMEESGVVL